ncbi:MAG TPA: ATP-binding protein [Acidimicrobiales bacterium]
MGDVVDLAFPVEADLVVLARLTAAAVAARAEFGVEEVEDLRLAVEELCLPYLRRGAGGRLHLRFERERGAIEISATLATAGGPGATGSEAAPGADSAADRDDLDEQDELSARILDALVDEHGRGIVEGQECRWLRKRRAENGR